MDRITKAIELAKQKHEAGGVVSTKTPLQKVVTEARRIEVDDEHLRKHGVICALESGLFADSYRLLRTRLLQRMRQNNFRTLGVTSTHPQAGKSLTSINLSLAIAMDQNYSCVVVDGDMRRPSIHRYLGIEPERGLGEYLQQDIDLSDVLLDIGVERFNVLPGLERVEGTSELLTGPKMSNLISGLVNKNNTQIAVFDLPPILVGDDVVALSEMLDAVILVVEEDVTDQSELEKALELLKETTVLGCVLNKAKDNEVRSYGDYY